MRKHNIAISNCHLRQNVDVRNQGEVLSPGNPVRIPRVLTSPGMPTALNSFLNLYLDSYLLLCKNGVIFYMLMVYLLFLILGFWGICIFCKADYVIAKAISLL